VAHKGSIGELVPTKLDVCSLEGMDGIVADSQMLICLSLEIELRD